jgi:3-oxoacyl-[acyl-carrier protein] reductase
LDAREGITITGATSQRVAIITGGSRGIGYATAEILAQQDLALVLVASDAANLSEARRRLIAAGAEPNRVACYVADVGDDRSVGRAFESIIDDFGRVDVLVNAAGIGGPFHRADEVAFEEWERIVRVNLFGVHSICSRALPVMARNGFGRIVNVASILGSGGARLSSTYAASKHAVIGYTKCIAAEFAALGITANTVSPGYVETRAGAQDDAVDGHRDRILARTPAGRLASPSEIARVVSFLALLDSTVLTGTDVVVDGGLTAHLGIT